MFASRMFASRGKSFTLDSFVAQFQVDGADYLYRQDARGAPIRVNADERQRFIAEFEGRLKIEYQLLTAVVAFFLIGVSVYATWANIDVPDWIIVAACVVICIIFAGGLIWAKNAPARELRGRAPVGKALSQIEARAKRLKNITYKRLAVCAAVPLVIALLRGFNHGFKSGSDWLWLSIAVGLTAFAGVQTLRKWRYDRPSNSASS